MKSSSAISKFINSPGYNSEMSYTKANITEIKEFKDSCTSEEWTQFGRQACEVLGEAFEE